MSALNAKDALLVAYRTLFDTAFIQAHLPTLGPRFIQLEIVGRVRILVDQDPPAIEQAARVAQSKYKNDGIVKGFLDLISDAECQATLGMQVQYDILAEFALIQGMGKQLAQHRLMSRYVDVSWKLIRDDEGNFADSIYTLAK